MSKIEKSFFSKINIFFSSKIRFFDFCNFRNYFTSFLSVTICAHLTCNFVSREVCAWVEGLFCAWVVTHEQLGSSTNFWKNVISDNKIEQSGWKIFLRNSKNNKNTKIFFFFNENSYFYRHFRKYYFFGKIENSHFWDFFLDFIFFKKYFPPWLKYFSMYFSCQTWNKTPKNEGISTVQTNSANLNPQLSKTKKLELFKEKYADPGKKSELLYWVVFTWSEPVS